MSEHYTDEDVQAVAKILSDEGGNPGSSLHSWRCEYDDECDCLPSTAHFILDAVAKKIAARTLRQAALDYAAERWQNRVTAVTYLKAEDFLLRRADEIAP